MDARWTIYLLNKGEQPLCYFVNMTNSWALKRVVDAARKVLDGSDADAMIFVRSDKHPSEYNVAKPFISIEFAKEE